VEGRDRNGRSSFGGGGDFYPEEHPEEVNRLDPFYKLYRYGWGEEGKTLASLGVHLSLRKGEKGVSAG